jgi:hypothetical protein
LENAVKDVNDAVKTLQEASKDYKVPMTTLRNNLEKLRTKGRPQFFSNEDEERLVDGLIYLANYGFGFTIKLILEAIQNFIANNQTKYKNFKGKNLTKIITNN